MRKLLLGAALSALMTGSALAENIGVSMALFDDNFLTVLRNGMITQYGPREEVLRALQPGPRPALAEVKS